MHVHQSPKLIYHSIPENGTRHMLIKLHLQRGGLECVTANYTLNDSGGINVINCQTLIPGNVTCVRAFASIRESGNSPSHLQVQFPPLPPGPYNVAELLGDKEYGYYAAAVFSCEAPVPGAPDAPTWYIIVRNPYFYDLALQVLANKLRCKGYDLSKEQFYSTNQGAGCKYFDGPEGFEYVTIPSTASASGSGFSFGDFMR